MRYSVNTRKHIWFGGLGGLGGFFLTLSRESLVLVTRLGLLMCMRVHVRAAGTNPRKPLNPRIPQGVLMLEWARSARERLGSSSWTVSELCCEVAEERWPTARPGLSAWLEEREGNWFDELVLERTPRDGLLDLWRLLTLDEVLGGTL